MSVPPRPPGRAARNPGKTGGIIGAAAAALISLAAAFGLPLTEEQALAIVAALAVLGPWIVGWFTDRRTTPYRAPRSRDGYPLVRDMSAPSKKQG